MSKKSKKIKESKEKTETLEPSRKSLSKRVYYFALLLPLLYFVSSFFLVKDYGITVDEPACFDFGHKYWEFYKTGYLDIYGSTPADENHPDFSVNWEEGIVWPFLNTLSAVTCDIFYKDLKILTPIDAHHMIIPIIISIFLYILFIFISRNFGVYIGLMTSLALITYPYFFGFAYNNTKDIPRLAIFATILFTFYKWYDTKQLKYFYASFILWGFFNAIRVEATLLPVMVLIWMIPGIYRNVRDGSIFRSRLYLHLTAASLIALFLYVLCWPPLLPWAYDNLKDFREDGVKFGMDIINFMKLVGTPNSPEYTWNIYALRQIYYLTPLQMLIFFAIGLIPVIKGSFKNSFLALLLVWIILIVGRHCMPNVAHYCGMRHFLDFLIPFIIIVSIGSELCAGILSKALSLNPNISRACVGVVLLFPNIQAIFKYHPYEVLYYNQIAGGLKGAVQKQVPWCFDYFLTSYRETADWINKNAVKDAHYFAVYDSVIFRLYITRKDLKGIFRRPGSSDYPPNTYLIENMPRLDDARSEGPFERVFQVRRDEGIVSSIYFISADSMEAYQDLQRAIDSANKGDFENALLFSTKAVSKGPKLAQAHLLQGMVYLKKGLIEQSRASFNKVLEIVPNDPMATQYLNQINLGGGRQQGYK